MARYIEGTVSFLPNPPGVFKDISCVRVQFPVCLPQSISILKGFSVLGINTHFAILRSWRVCLECVTSKSGSAGGQYGWSVRHYPYKDSPEMLKAKDTCASFLLLFKNN